MKVAAIYGNMRHGSTWHTAHLVMDALGELVPLEITEFFLPRDMPHFCVGCFSCINRGEEFCPHAGSVGPIARAIEEADLVVFASPAYVLDVSGQMKALLDHLAYRWLPHRPHPNMFRKLGLAVVTTAGAGLSHALKTLRSTFSFCGFLRFFSFGFAVAASSWEEVKPEKKAKMEAAARLLAKKLAAAYKKRERLPARPFVRILFGAMSGQNKKAPWCAHDAEFWREQGWLSGKNPF